VPFIVRNNPDVDDVVVRWNTEGYLEKIFGEGEFHAEHSVNNHFMYWRKLSDKKQAKKYVPPTDMVSMTYKEWTKKAAVKREVESEHWYFR